MFGDHEHVWWIVGAGQQVRHAITERPGARPAGDVVAALCADPIKIPSHTWPATKEPVSRGITARCPRCEQQLDERQQRDTALVVTNWDC